MSPHDQDGRLGSLRSAQPTTEHRSPRRAALHRGLELVAEFGEFIGGEIGDGPEVQAALAPASDVEALEAFGLRRARLGGGGLRHEQVDDMQAAAIDDGADGAGVDVIEPAADQGKTLRGEVDHGRRHVEPAVEPGFYGVLVGRQHVGEVAGLQRAQMRRYDFGFEPLPVVVAQHNGDEAGGGDRGDRRSHRKAAQHRAPARHDLNLRLRLWQRRFDALAQRQGSRVAQLRAGHRLLQFANRGKLSGAGRAGRDMSLDLARMAGVELAVDQRMQQDFRLVAGHFGGSSSASQAERSMARARASRDITVPTGTAAISAISRYERFWISRKTKVSRNGSASALTSRRIAPASRWRDPAAG